VDIRARPGLLPTGKLQPAAISRCAQLPLGKLVPVAISTEMAAFPAGAEDDSFSFCPSDDRLVDHYLRAKIQGTIGGLSNAAYFLDADVCPTRPEELVRAHGTPARVSSQYACDGKQFYFFSTAHFVGASAKRRSRTISVTGKNESWHAEGRPKPVEWSTAGGYVQKFSYHVRIGPRTGDVEKPGWIMAEYSFENPKEGDSVLCKIYRSPRGPGRSANSGCKRKAADDLEAATPSTRPRQTEEHEDGVMLFAGNLERDLQSVSVQDPAPALEFDEMSLEEFQNWMMTDIEDSGTILQGENSEASANSDCKRKAADDLEAATPSTQPRQTEEHEDDVLLFARNLEAVTPSTQPRQTEEHKDDAMLFAGNLERDLQSVSVQDPAPAPGFDEMSLEEFQNWMMTDVEDNGTILQGENSEAYYMRVMLGDNDDQQQDAGDEQQQDAVQQCTLSTSCSSTVPSRIEECFVEFT
jgi:hypothetical protein